MSVSEILNIGSATAGVTSVSTSMEVWGSIEFALFGVVHTLYLKSLSGHSSVCYKTILNTGGVGGARADPQT